MASRLPYELSQFLPFGLTLSRLPPTVTERNRYRKRRLAGNRGKMPSEYAKTLGARLRAIRTQQGLSLHGVEEKSRGRWKAVVVGSYERGDRSVTLPKLVIDLERMAQLPKDKAGPLARYVATIQSQRGDYNGRVLSIRQEDLRSLAVIYDKSPIDLTEELISWGVLDSEARGAVETF